MHLTVRSIGLEGVTAFPQTITIESRERRPALSVIGLGDWAARTLSLTVAAALAASRSTAARVDHNYAAVVQADDRPPYGPACGAAIALGLLAAEGAFPAGALADTAVFAGVHPDGRLARRRGALVAAEHCQRHHIRRLIVAAPNGPEAAIVDHVEIIAVENLHDAAAVLAGATPPPIATARPRAWEVDEAPVRLDPNAALLAEVVAATRLSVIVDGPLAAGKRLAGWVHRILPPLTLAQQHQQAAIRSVAGRDPSRPTRAFRCPHHSISLGGLLGGGALISPGEVQLATHGVLALFEVDRFGTPALIALRAATQRGSVTVCRGAVTVAMPAKPWVVATMDSAASSAPKRQIAKIVAQFDVRARVVESVARELWGVERAAAGGRVRRAHEALATETFAVTAAARRAIAHLAIGTQSVTARMAHALAALDGRTVVAEQDICRANELRGYADTAAGQ